MVDIPIGDSLVTNLVYRSCVVQIEDQHLLVDLILLDIQDFDVILGMDWLSTYHAIVDCYSKRVTFHIWRCHNPIFTHGIFSGVGTQNEAARTKSAWSGEGLSHRITSEHNPGHISQNSGSFDQVWPRLTKCWPRFDRAIPNSNRVHHAQKPSKGGPGYISQSLESFDQVWPRLTKFDQTVDQIKSWIELTATWLFWRAWWELRFDTLRVKNGREMREL